MIGITVFSFLILLPLTGVAVDFPNKKNLFADTPISTERNLYSHDLSEYTKFNTKLDFIAKNFHKTEVEIIEVERLGGGLVNDKLGLISSESLLLPNRKLDQLRGVQRPLSTVQGSHEFLFLDQVLDNLNEVYKVFKKQLAKNRDVFTDGFVEALKSEDFNTNLERLHFISIYNSRVRFSPKNIDKPVAGLKTFFGIFDGQESKKLKSPSKLPFELKHPEYKLEERELGIKVMEIKRLISPGLGLDHVVRVISEHLIQAQQQDYSLIVHTDRAGSVLFRRYGFKLTESFSDKTYLLKATAESFIEKNLPKEIYHQHYPPKCTQL